MSYFERLISTLPANPNLQEQSSLLDPHLEGMMEVITTRARSIMLSVYEKQRAAVDASGAFFPFQCERNPQQHALYCVVYNLCRCRGYKTVVKFFPHEVSDMEPLMCMLQSQDRMDHACWESRYALLLWLSIEDDGPSYAAVFLLVVQPQVGFSFHRK